MDQLESKRYHIVNGAQLPSFVDKTVSVLGVVTKDGGSGSSSFTLNTSDSLSVTVFLNKPLDRELNGQYIEVRGTCENFSGARVIKAEEYFTFNNKTFDANSHTSLCKFINSIPHIYSNN